MAELPQPDEVEARERARMSASEVSWALRETQRAQASVDRRLALQLALRPVDYQALNHVMTAEEPIGPAELSARLAISTGSGTELVDRLETAGHLQRHPHQTDRRRRILQPTPAAVDRILGQLGPLFTALDDLADGFTPEEQSTVIRYLRAAADCLNEYAENTDVTRRG